MKQWTQAQQMKLMNHDHSSHAFQTCFAVLTHGLPRKPNFFQVARAATNCWFNVHVLSILFVGSCWLYLPHSAKTQHFNTRQKRLGRQRQLFGRVWSMTSIWFCSSLFCLRSSHQLWCWSMARWPDVAAKLTRSVDHGASWFQCLFRFDVQLKYSHCYPLKGLLDLSWVFVAKKMERSNPARANEDEAPGNWDELRQHVLKKPMTLFRLWRFQWIANGHQDFSG